MVSDGDHKFLGFAEVGMAASCTQWNVFGAVLRVSEQSLATSESQEAQDVPHDTHLVRLFRKNQSPFALRCHALYKHDKPKRLDISILTTCNLYTWLTDCRSLAFIRLLQPRFQSCGLLS